LTNIGEYRKLFSGALAKSGSFGFPEGSALCFRAKPKEPLVRMTKIELKKM